MRRAVVLVLVLVLGGGIAAAVLPHRGGERPEVVGPPPAQPRLLVGFLDDANFRWRPYRARMLDRAHATGARLIRALVYWHLVAPRRSAPGKPPFDEPRLYELDELVAGASARGMEVLFTIWGTPAWASGGRRPNHPPTDPDDLRRFAHTLAARYPQVRRFAVWNEPNTELFLAPQFDAAGRSVGPRAYARLYRAAYEGIKSANPRASSRSARRPHTGGTLRTAAGLRTATRRSASRGSCPVSARASSSTRGGHHPYPTTSKRAPDKHARWPAVTLTSLERFGGALDRWFGRHDIPLWITEYGYEASPDEPLGVSPELQATYAAQAIELAASVPRVRLFVWFTFRDDYTNTWQSGLLDGKGRPRPAYERFAAVTQALGG